MYPIQQMTNGYKSNISVLINKGTQLQAYKIIMICVVINSVIYKQWSNYSLYPGPK